MSTDPSNRLGKWFHRCSSVSNRGSVLGWLAVVTGALLLWFSISIPGWVCWLLGLLLFARRETHRPDSCDVPYAWLWLTLVLATGLLLRTWGLSHVPPGCWQDEAETGLETLRILAHDWFVFTPNNNGRGSLQFFWTAPFFAVFGSRLEILRLAMALIGVVSIFASWRMLRPAAGPWMALAAAAFLSFSFWDVRVSRLGFDAVMTPLLDILVVAAVWQGYRRRSLTWFLGSGLLLAVANYGYAASRFSVLLWLAALWLLRDRGWDRSSRGRAWIAAATGLLLGILPLAHYAWSHPRDFFQRPRQVSVLDKVGSERSLKPWLRTTRATLRMLLERGDANPRHNLPGRPMLDPITGALLAAGLAAAWRSRHDPWNQVMGAWLGIALMGGGSLTEPAPHGLRTLSAVVPIAFFAGRGLQEAISAMTDPRRRTGAAAVVLALLAVFTSVGYFRFYARDPRVGPEFSAQATLAGQYLRDHPREKIAIISRSLSVPVVKFTANRPDLAITALDPAVMPELPDAVYLFARRDELPGWMNAEPAAVSQHTGPMGEAIFRYKRNPPY